LITGFFEGYSGIDENTDESRFSCIFYISGTYKNGEISIETYYPLDKADDLIIGKLEIKDSNKLLIKLDAEHGGCWNVWNFTNDFSEFNLADEMNWLEIRYVDVDKVFFYDAKNEESKRKNYILKGDIVYIDKIENEWVHCRFLGKTITEGWIKKESINK
jgi:hypothetical protein